MNRKNAFNEGLRVLVAFMFLAIILLTLLQVVFRFVINSPLVWSEELARFLLVWMVMIGAAVNLFDNKLLSINSFIHKLPEKVHFALYLAQQVLIAIFLLATAISSFDILRLSLNNTAGALEMPLAYWRASSTFGCFLLLVFLVIKTVKTIVLFCSGSYSRVAEHEVSVWRDEE